MKIDSFLFTNAGGRECNEDAIGHSICPAGNCFVIADGLGGHSNGQTASSAVVESLKKTEWSSDPESMLEILRKQLFSVHENILELQQTSKSDMKSTVVALFMSENHAVYGNVGDSRLYHLHGGTIDCLTKDHSVAYKKYKSGEINKYQINHDEDQSRLLRALGNPRKFEADCYSLQPAAGDGFLLCSDGLWTFLTEEEILIDFLKSNSAYEWMQLLLLRAVDKMPLDSDNFSAITILVQ